MLDYKIDPFSAVDSLVASQEQPIGTVFQYPIDVVTKFTDKPSWKVNDGNPLVPGGDETAPEVTYNATDNSNKFTRQIDIPTALGLDLTDKSSAGVFEKSFDRAAPVQPDFPVDATSLNNPAVDGLGTGIIGNASPLGANYAGQNVLVQGTDPMNPPQFGATPELANDVTQEATKPSDCSWYDVKCKFGTIKGEVTILIVGLVLLAIGIYAMTR